MSQRRLSPGKQSVLSTEHFSAMTELTAGNRERKEGSGERFREHPAINGWGFAGKERVGD